MLVFFRRHVYIYMQYMRCVIFLRFFLVTSTQQVYACVADGVGSWRNYGIDPRDYSRKLTENARLVIEHESESKKEAKSLFGNDHDIGVDDVSVGGWITVIVLV